MARQYQNIISFVKPHGFTLITQKEDYCIIEQEKRTIVFKCVHGHEMKLGHAVFINKKSKFLRENLPMKDFCSVCVSLKNKNESEQKFKNDIEESTGHTIIELDNQTREVIYRCGNCQEKNHSYIQSLKVNTGYCQHCQNEQFKLEYDDVKQRVEEKGLTLLLKQDEYKNNKQYLPLICSCGNTYESVLRDISKGKICMKCQPERIKKTCLEKYGEDNVSKVPSIFYKILQSQANRKHVILPKTGRELIVMGYEPHAIMFLLQQDIDPILNRKIEEDDIIVGKDVPRFRYEMDDATKHLYFPDMLIRSSNLIIEVKSVYTFHYHVRMNYLKFRKVVEDGYRLRLLMFKGYKKELIDITCTTLDDVEQILLL
jgi:hypothetical protein